MGLINTLSLIFTFTVILYILYISFTVESSVHTLSEKSFPRSNRYLQKNTSGQQVCKDTHISSSLVSNEYLTKIFFRNSRASRSLSNCIIFEIEAEHTLSDTQIIGSKRSKRPIPYILRLIQ